MRTLFLDCLSGISGDMIVGALCDLGVELDAIKSALSSLGLDAEFHIRGERQTRRNIAGVKFDVLPSDLPHPVTPAPHDHAHEAAHNHPHGRSYREIRGILERSALSDFVKLRSLAVFRRIAAAEGKIHGMAADAVTFHEIGAIDSIVDIVAACACIEALGIERVYCSSLFDGTGTIECAHGTYPLPAPATLEILTGIPIRQIDEPFEFITPTGAAIVAEFAHAVGLMPEMRIERIGYGVGGRDTDRRPNVLRAVLGETASPDTCESDEIVQIETNLDDITPELVAVAVEGLLSAGALDVFLTPAQMKKSRPGTVLTVLCRPDDAERLAGQMLAETTAFGVRMQRATRVKLRREFCDVATPFGPVRIKLGYRGPRLVQASPEFESCRSLAAKTGASIRDIFRAACAAAERRNEIAHD